MVLIWNVFSPWDAKAWGNYFLIVFLICPVIASFFTTIWFIIGGVIDMRRLFRDLKMRTENPLDNGQVEGNISIADAKIFTNKEKEANNNKE